MTLYQMTHIMEVIASRQPSVNMIVENDVFRLNNKADARYGVFAFTQGQHTTSIDSSLINFAFSLFYVDRLRADKGNQIEIQSTGIATLDNIIRLLDEKGISASSYSFQTFNQRFLDECAGVFCNVTFSVPISTLCGEQITGDYNEDFNEDFLVY